jgi:hypothetical protein
MIMFWPMMLLGVVAVGFVLAVIVRARLRYLDPEAERERRHDDFEDR